MPSRVTNFGKNLDFLVTERFTPANAQEQQVLDILQQYRDRSIRVRGALHSWSDVAYSHDIMLDLRQWSEIQIDPEQKTVTVGAGCTLQHLLDTLAKQGWTLPTMGSVTKQTIAGAILTATHGSGKESLSHYVQDIKLATYDPETKKPVILMLSGTNVADRDALRAARCSLGYLGVVLTVTLQCIPAYDVTETLDLVDSLEAVLRTADSYPLQQFVYIPYAWQFYVLRRKESGASRTRNMLSKYGTYLYRMYKLVIIDIGLHALVKMFAFVSPGWFIRFFYQQVFPRIAVRGRYIRVTDTDQHTLTLRHDFYRHLEMEVFVPEGSLCEALQLARYITEIFARGRAERATRHDEMGIKLQRVPGMVEALKKGAGSYTHHYPLVCRRILPDDALISMSSGDNQAYYSISFFTYRPSNPLFSSYCHCLATCLVALYKARLHWGKHFPLTYSEIKDAYGEESLQQFRKLCMHYDAYGTFQNPYARRVLGFPHSPT
jgi:FAD binding domain-containing protein/D-arabinono-1,4-lactone oxidase